MNRTLPRDQRTDISNIYTSVSSALFRTHYIAKRHEDWIMPVDKAVLG